MCIDCNGEEEQVEKMEDNHDNLERTLRGFRYMMNKANATRAVSFCLFACAFARAHAI